MGNQKSPHRGEIFYVLAINYKHFPRIHQKKAYLINIYHLYYSTTKKFSRKMKVWTKTIVL